MYSNEEIGDIIKEAVFEETNLLNGNKDERYQVIQSLKSRLYDAFGLEDDII
jgi:hypothetical protein